MNPPLTTVAQPAEEIGERCFRRLARALAEPGSESGVEIVPHRLVRSATPHGNRVRHFGGYNHSVCNQYVDIPALK